MNFLSFQLSPFAALLCFLAVLAHASYGKRLGIRGRYTSSVVGLALSGLIAGFLANYCAILIRPFALLSIFCGAWLAWKDFGWRLNLSSLPKRALPYLLFIVVFTFANHPWNVFFETTGPEGSISVVFNRHYSYYASLSYEMLNADYWARLRIASAHDYAWSIYHFFVGGAYSVMQAFLPHPGLFSYFTAQFVLIGIILLSFMEFFLSMSPKQRGRGMIACLLWFLIGFTAFPAGLNWSLLSNNIFAVFAIFHLVWAVLQNRWQEGIIYSVTLAFGAIRFLPVGGISAVLIAFFWWQEIERSSPWKVRLRLLVKKFSRWHGIALLIVAIYLGATLFASKKVGGGVPGSYEFYWSAGWLYILSFYKWLGATYHALKLPHPYQLFDAEGLIDPIQASRPLLIFWITTVLVGIAVLFYLNLRTHLLKLREEPRWQVGFLIAVFAYLIGFALIRKAYLDLHVLFILYLFVTLLVLGATPVWGPKRFSAATWIAVVQLVSLGFLYTGIGAVQGPVLYITLDLLLWCLIGALILSIFLRPFSFPATAAVTFLGIACFVSFPMKFLKICRLAKDRHEFILPVDNYLNDPGLRFDDLVDGKGYLKQKFEKPELNDAVSAYLGARMRYDPKHIRFTINDFLGKKVD